MIRAKRSFVKCGNWFTGISIDLKIDNRDRVSIPTKIVATFNVEHPIHETTYDPK